MSAIPAPVQPLPPNLRNLRVGETACVGDWCAGHNTGEWNAVRSVRGDMLMRTEAECIRFARELKNEDVVAEVISCCEKLRANGVIPATIRVNPVLLTEQYRPVFLRECERLGITVTFEPAPSSG